MSKSLARPAGRRYYRWNPPYWMRQSAPKAPMVPEGENVRLHPRLEANLFWEEVQYRHAYAAWRQRMAARALTLLLAGVFSAGMALGWMVAWRFG